MYAPATNPVGFPRRLTRYLLRISSNVAWNTYHHWLRLRHGSSKAFARDENYANRHFVTGRVSASALENLANIFEVSPSIDFRADDYAPGYRWTYHADAKKVNQSFVHHDVRGKWKQYLLPAIEEIAPYVNAALGTPWRIVRSRAYAITASEVSKFDTGANVWHTDQLNNAMTKVLIYLTPVDEKWGTTQVRLADGSTETIRGDVGTFLVFDPTKLLHRGLPPSTGRRETIEFTFAAAAKIDKRPFMAGLNAVYPWMPWCKTAKE